MNAQEWNLKGEEHWQRSDYTSALEAFQQSTTLEPDYAAAILNEGAALVALKRYEEGIAVIDKGMTTVSDDPIAYAWKSVAQYGLGNKQEALTSIDQALALNHEDRFALDLKNRMENGLEIVF